MSQPADSYPIARNLVRELREAAMTVATAESLTGGLVVGALTSVPGASAVVRGGLVVYATDLKAALAGVPMEVLQRDGPVSAPAASAMAVGARDRCGATYGVATTGVAGPDAQDGHAPGTLHVAVASPTTARVASYPPNEVELQDRQAIRLDAVIKALSLLLDVIRDGESHTRESWTGERR